LWLVDQYLEEGSIIIDINEVIRKTNINIIRDNSIFINGLYIKEILYKSNSHWKLRDVKLDYMHPYEYSVFIPPSQDNNLSILKLFIDIYYDDFGTY
jgi:hypothetical protein